MTSSANLNRHLLSSLLASTFKGSGMNISTPNQFVGTIQTITHGAVNTEVQLAVGHEQKLVVMITQQSATALDLTIGDSVIAVVNTAAILLTTDTGMMTSAQNRLIGTISQINRGAVNSDIMLSLASGVTLNAMVTKASEEALVLQVGQVVSALFNATAVMLLKPESRASEKGSSQPL